MKTYLLAAACVAAMTGVAWAQAAPPPASAFGRIPAVQQASISPNGQTVAMLGGSPTERTLSFATIDKPNLPVLNLGAVNTVSIRWAGDEYVLARVAVWEKIGAKNTYRFERNISVTPDAKPMARLLEQDTLSQQLIEQPVLGVTPSPKARALVLGLQPSSGPSASNDTRLKRKGDDDFRVVALWNVDPATGKGALAERGTLDTSTWDVDLAGQARVRIDVDKLNHQFTLLGRPKGSANWGNVLVDLPEDEGWETYVGYSDPDDAVYLTKAVAGGTQLLRQSLKDGAVTPIGRLAAGGLSAIWDERRGLVVGLTPGASGGSPEWLDAEIGGVHAALSKVFKGRIVELKSWSTDRSRFVVRVGSAAAPASWFLFDRPQKQLSPLGDEYPELKDAPLGATRSITYAARDGLQITAYLTSPVGGRPGKAPLIVLPHDGPESHDDEDFDWLTQYLVTRGYAVLRPQYRGSTGYGRDFELAGRGEWGGKMQTDLLDGVAFVAASGEIDPSRVCIVGISFGGYAALAGATLHNDAYRCAAAIAGISDLGVLINDNKRKFDRASSVVRSLRRMLGDADTAKLRAISPLQQVSAVRVPILLVHGDQDGVVPIEQSKLMADALKESGKPVEFLTLAGEGHDLLNSGSRTQMLETLGAFLAKNLPVKP
jgi:dipeptidyl aminopeptidase/acylaminoacyl peptidase